MKDKADEVVMSPMTTAALVTGVKKGRGRPPKVKTPFFMWVLLQVGNIRVRWRPRGVFSLSVMLERCQGYGVEEEVEAADDGGRGAGCCAFDGFVLWIALCVDVGDIDDDGDDDDDGGLIVVIIVAGGIFGAGGYGYYC
ncbi:uncharacterized protein A4U43_C08F31870 [Asparagus officinalis]|nr:uncharacterized protein A4U43_C08F31870 [Asparagus officinalis]